MDRAFKTSTGQDSGSDDTSVTDLPVPVRCLLYGITGYYYIQLTVKSGKQGTTALKIRN